MKTENIDYSLYLVTDRSLARGRNTLEIIRAAVDGGATVVQLREKDCSTREFIEQAMAIKDFLKGRGVPLIINDRVDVAQAVEADGELDGVRLRRLLPALDGHAAVAGVKAEHNSVREGLGQFNEQVRLFNGDAADHDPTDPCGEVMPGRCERADAAAQLAGHAGGGDDRVSPQIRVGGCGPSQGDGLIGLGDERRGGVH